MDFGNSNTRNAGAHCKRDDPEGSKSQQDHFTDFANPKLNNDKWDQRKRRDRTHEFHNRIKPTTKPIRLIHSESK